VFFNDRADDFDDWIDLADETALVPGELRQLINLIDRRARVSVATLHFIGVRDRLRSTRFQMPMGALRRLPWLDSG